MKSNKQRLAYSKILHSARRYLIFFILVSFVVTCCMLLFLFALQKSTQIDLTKEKIELASRLTFANVIIISLLFSIIDGIRHRIMVTRPVRHIVNGVKKIIDGDFSVRIKPLSGLENRESYNIIIDYFNKLAEELSGIETLRNDFISNVSHELKTPLAVIQNYGKMLQEADLLESERIEYAKAVTDSSHKLTELITNILKLNKLENQKIFPQKQVFNLSEQLCECLLNFEDVWEKKQIDITCDIAQDVYITSDPQLLSLVWNNLFSNAFKFTDNGGQVGLSLKTDEKYVFVSVQDNGCGINPDIGKRIFEKFYQGDSSHATQGNGLGLALVKRVADIVGGDISVNSEIDKGSTFTFKIAYET